MKPILKKKIMAKEILTEHEKEQARQTSLEVVKTILTLGFNHLFRWIVSLVVKK